MPNDLMCEREQSLHEASFLAHFLHLHRALWRCDVVLESDVCLTYCVPLADSLCSFVRVQHVLFIYFGREGVACIHKSYMGRLRCITALENILF